MIDYAEVIQVATQVMIIAGLISLVVSLLMEFLIKKMFSLKTNIINGIILGLSEALTVLSGVIFMQIKEYQPAWYIWVGIVFLGFLVAIISMNGYDKVFSYVYTWIKELYNGKNE